MVLQARRHLENIPLLVRITQNRRTLSRKELKYRDAVRSSGFIGLNQFCGSLAKMNWKKEVVVGPVDDPNIYKEIEEEQKEVLNKHRDNYIHKYAWYWA